MLLLEGCSWNGAGGALWECYSWNAARATVLEGVLGVLLEEGVWRS